MQWPAVTVQLQRTLLGFPGAWGGVDVAGALEVDVLLHSDKVGCKLPHVLAVVDDAHHGVPAREEVAAKHNAFRNKHVSACITNLVWFQGSGWCMQETRYETTIGFIATIMNPSLTVYLYILAYQLHRIILMHRSMIRYHSLIINGQYSP